MRLNSLLFRQGRILAFVDLFKVVRNFIKRVMKAICEAILAIFHTRNARGNRRRGISRPFKEIFNPRMLRLSISLDFHSPLFELIFADLL